VRINTGANQEWDFPLSTREWLRRWYVRCLSSSDAVDHRDNDNNGAGRFNYNVPHERGV
jgi:hypothetical protein